VDGVIDSDLVYAMSNLPIVGAAKNESRINQDMARQLAGEAYLRMGMRDASYFKKAEDAVTPVITSGKYELISARYGKYAAEPGDYYHDMFRWGNQRRSQGNAEAIWTFEMEYNRDVNGGTIDNPQQRRNWVPAFHKLDGMVNADSIGGRGNGRLRLSNFVKYGLYEKGDIRNSNYNIRRVMWYNKPGFSKEFGIDAKGFLVDKDKGVRNVTLKTGDRVIPHAGDSLNVFYPHTTKWGAYDETDDFGYAVVKDWPVMRLGETYLLRAEARFRQGNTQGAADDINVLRDRAFKDYRGVAPGAGKVTADQIDIDFILDERARELYLEEWRYLELSRVSYCLALSGKPDEWGNTYDVNTYDKQEGTDPNGGSYWYQRIMHYNEFYNKNPELIVKNHKYTIDKRNLYLPIPQSAIDANRLGKLRQNYGYDKYDDSVPMWGNWQEAVADEDNLSN